MRNERKRQPKVYRRPHPAVLSVAHVTCVCSETIQTQRLGLDPVLWFIRISRAQQYRSGENPLLGVNVGGFNGSMWYFYSPLYGDDNC